MPTAFELLQKAQQSAAPKTKTATAKQNPKPEVKPDPAPETKRAVFTPSNAPVIVDNEILGRGFLVSFSCPIPGNEKVDRKVTSQVQSEHNMGKQSGKWDKTVFPPGIYKRLASTVNMVRTWHYANTLEWPMAGLQLLPAANHENYCKNMREFKRMVQEAQQTFLDAIPEMVKWAKEEHNGSFDETLYNPDRIKAKFGFSVSFLPIPASDHYVGALRNLLGEDALEVDSIVSESFEKAETQLWERLTTPLRNIQAILSKADSGERTRITDSLLENVAEIAKLIPALNVNNNPQLAEFAAEAEQAFKGLKTSDLKTDEVKRKEAREKAEAILRKMTGGK